MAVVLLSAAMHVCTIVARNYVPAARVLARSFLAHHPDGTCWTLVIDDVDGEVAGDAPFRVVRPQELGIELWDEMTAGYDVLELSTAVKPWLVRHLLHEREVARITYLDPDIRIYDSLGEVDELLAEHALVVTPHLTAAMPRDGHRPTETEILGSGSFNLGFAGFAAGSQTDALLDWWAERLATDCLVDPERGLFVDQRWMDLAPGLVPSLHVLRDSGYNVAYWNLAGRHVARDGDHVTVDGRPLRFFHFSGYDPEAPGSLSKHQDRIDLARHPVVRELCDGYGRELIAAGYREGRVRPYAFAVLADGTPLTRPARRVFREAVAAGEIDRASVFTQAGTAAFLHHLRGPAAVGGDRGVTRYLHSLWQTRADLREAFPDLAGSDGSRLAAWAALEPDEVPGRLGSDDPARLPGVTVAGYFTGVMGVGEHGRQLARALALAGLPVHQVTLRPDAAPEDPALGGEPAAEADGDDSLFNLLCANAEMVPSVAATLGPEFFAGRHTIGFWAWEVSSFPTRYMPAFSHLDEVWVGSRHVRDAVASVATVPVLVIPQPVSLPEGFAQARPPAGLPDGFRFLFAFDYLSVFERKNPLAVVAAFTRAFPPGSGAVLVLKTLNHDRDPVNHARVAAAAHAHPDVHLVTERLSAAERDGLMSSADCYVSLHRAEGFGYTMAESMWAGKPVIATGYSGNLDYMTPDNSYLVDHRLVPIGPGHDPYPPGGVWAEPAIEHATGLMREVFDDPSAAASRGARGAADVRASHGPEAAGAVMGARLKVLLEHPRWRSPGREAHRPGPLQTEWVERYIDSGPIPLSRSGRLAPTRAAARRALLRVLKPVTAHERVVDGGLLTAIHTLDANLRTLAEAHGAALSQIERLASELAQLREDSRSRADRSPDQVRTRSGSS